MPKLIFTSENLPDRYEHMTMLIVPFTIIGFAVLLIAAYKLLRPK